MPLMCLGQFVFELQSLPYQSLQQQRGWRHPSNSRVGQRPARQYTGKDDEALTLAGSLYHEITGHQSTIDDVKDMADSGSAWVLMDGSGMIYGCYVIEGLDLTRTAFDRHGVAKKIEFTLKLARVDDDETGAPAPKGNTPSAASGVAL